MSIRAKLDDFISIHCFKAVIVGMEDILGVEGTAAALISAGRRRGKDVAKNLGLEGKKIELAVLAQTLDKSLGENGTCLCEVAEVTATPEGGFYVKTGETVCTAGESSGSTRTCTYTMGAIMGFIESVMGVSLSGKQVANILNGSATDDFLFTPTA